MGRDAAGFNGLVTMHAIEAELSPECADITKNGQKAVGYRVEGSYIILYPNKLVIMTNASDS